MKEYGKIQGQIIEAKFQYEALKKGFIVSKPFGDSSKYDFIIDMNNKLHKIQIKSTANKAKNRTTYWISSSSYNHKLYDKTMIDFIIGYIIPTNDWYIIPITKIKTKGFRINPDKDKKYKQFKNAWHLLES